MNNNAVRKLYINEYFARRDEVLEGILQKSLLEDQMPTIQVDDNTGSILQMMLMLLKPKTVVEIGTLFGYSSIYIARSLPEGGHLISLEIDKACADLAKRNIKEAGLEERVTVLHKDAVEYLLSVPDQSIDALIIDGAKEEYPTYLKAGFSKLRSGGLLIADDALRWQDQDNEDRSIFNDEEIKGIDSYCRALGRSGATFSVMINSENGLIVSLKK